MKRTLLTTFLIFTALTGVLAADNNYAVKEALMAKAFTLLDETLTIIEGAKDEASSKEAVKKIQALLPKAKVLKAESVKLGMDTLSDKEKKQLEATFAQEQQKVQKRLFSAIAVLQKNPALASAFQDLQKELN